MIHAHLLCPERNWILAKLADRLMTPCAASDIHVTQGDKVNADADVTLWFNWFTWHSYGRPATKCNLLYWTHQNAENSDAFVVELLTAADHTMTMDTWAREQLIAKGVPANKLTTILPACDQDWQPRPIRLGITCRYYGDGRRCDSDILHAGKSGALDGYQLIIIGAGWGPMVKQLADMGVNVAWADTTGDYQRDYREQNHQIVPTLDYLWNVGRDTTLGVLDALLCGVPIISQRTSFAADFYTAPGAAHWYSDADTLAATLRCIKYRRWQMAGPVRQRTWATYGAEVAALFRRLVAERDAH